MKSINVLGQVYKIKMVKGMNEKTGAIGLCDAEKSLISLDSSLKGKYLRRVLLHEIAHAFAFESGLYEFMNQQSSEMFAQSLSSFLVQLKNQLFP